MRDLKHGTSSQAPTRWMRFRVHLLGLAFFACLGLLFTRAYQLQVRQREHLRELASDQYRRAMDIPARRGDILDRRGVPLAQSVDVDSVWVDPALAGDPRLAAKRLARATGVNEAELRERLVRGGRFAWVKRRASPAEAEKVKALRLPGVGFVKEPRRFYPQRELAAHLVGVVGADAHGLDGLELAFEDELSGERLVRVGLRDAKGRRLLTQGADDPQAREGATLTLTIDRHLQFVTERALQRAVDEARATAGSAVLLDPRTGELLAIANVPRFNPNAPSRAGREAMRNRAVTDAVEPGSTFKPFVVAAALDARVVEATTRLDCEKGAFRVGRNIINDTHPHEILDVRQVLQVSSNICAAKIAQKLGRRGLADALARFGFGARGSLGLPSEGRGVVAVPTSDIALATASFGQGVTATAVQLAAAYGALANGGMLMRPYVVSRVVDPDGVVLLENRPTEVRRVVSKHAARAVVSMLESVVERGGTAPRARLDDYRVAGKTGTAQKADPLVRGYSDKRIASFAGIVPAEEPRLVVLVVIDEPKGEVYGGQVAAPAFTEIVSQAMPYLAVAPSRVAAAAGKPPPSAPVAAPVEALVAAPERVTGQLGAGSPPATPGFVRAPDVVGLASRRAVVQVLGAALEPRVVGSGRVVAQSPTAGSLIEKGSHVTLELAGSLPAATW